MCRLQETITYVDPYFKLREVYMDAVEQASAGKGFERHASGESYDKQPICHISRSVGDGYWRGQAIKKIIESQRLAPDAAIQEVLGALNYLAAGVILMKEKEDDLSKV